jgi:hypothetical protein
MTPPLTMVTPREFSAFRCANGGLPPLHCPLLAGTIGCSINQSFCANGPGNWSHWYADFSQIQCWFPPHRLPHWLMLNPHQAHLAVCMLLQEQKTAGGRETTTSFAAMWVGLQKTSGPATAQLPQRWRRRLTLKRRKTQDNPNPPAPLRQQIHRHLDASRWMARRTQDHPTAGSPCEPSLPTWTVSNLSLSNTELGTRSNCRPGCFYYLLGLANYANNWGQLPESVTLTFCDQGRVSIRFPLDPPPLLPPGR